MGFSARQLLALRRKLDGRQVRTRQANGRELSYIEGWYAISEAEPHLRLRRLEPRNDGISLCASSGKKASRNYDRPNKITKRMVVALKWNGCKFTVWDGAVLHFGWLCAPRKRILQ